MTSLWKKCANLLQSLLYDFQVTIKGSSFVNKHALQLWASFESEPKYRKWQETQRNLNFWKFTLALKKNVVKKISYKFQAKDRSFNKKGQRSRQVWPHFYRVILFLTYPFYYHLLFADFVQDICCENYRKREAIRLHKNPRNNNYNHSRHYYN